MIVLTDEYLTIHWKKLVAESTLTTVFSEWDDGDAYTLASIGVLPSNKTISGAITLQNDPIPNVSLVIRLIKLAGESKTYDYQSLDGNKYQATAERSAGESKESLPVEIANIDQSLSSRRGPLIETGLLKSTSVLVVGLGTGGIQIALELAKAGVGEFILVDPDRLEIGNVSRHQAGISFAGRSKVLAARDLILEKNPKATIETFAIRADTESLSTLAPLVQKADLVINATDNRPSKLFVNSLCIEAKKPAIYGGAFRRAYGGHILRVRPGQSACFHCFVLAMPDKEADQEISSHENAEAIAYSDRPVPVEPGLSLDVAPIAIMVAKLALQELIRDKKSSLHVLDKDLDAGWYLWVNRPEPGTDYAAWPPLSESTDEMTILRWYGIYLDREKGCPTCGDFSQAMRDQYGIDEKTIVTPGASFLPDEIKPPAN